MIGKHGVYTPINKEKYIGSKLPIFRSSWQLRAFVSLDKNQNILKWGSENFVIPYIDKTRNNEVHKYIVDIFFEIANATQDGRPIKWLIEIKPLSQCTTPVQSKRKSAEKLLYQSMVVTRNQCKWQAAIKFCKSKRMAFWSLYRKRHIKTLLNLENKNKYIKIFFINKVICIYGLEYRR